MKATGPLFKWFGSKWNASRFYPTPRFKKIFEPFAGSAAYSLRHAEREVTIWDSNPLLQELWRWLIDGATESAIRAIPLGTPIGTNIRELGLSRGQELLLKHWQRTNNVGDCWTISPWGDKPGQWTANTRARVAEEHQVVKHWRLENRFSAAGTYFVDPPYQFNYSYKSPPLDYAGLAQFLLAIEQPNQLIVCEAECPKTGAAPSWLPFKPFRKTVTSRRKANEHHHSNELIWLSNT